MDKGTAQRLRHHEFGYQAALQYDPGPLQPKEGRGEVADPDRWAERYSALADRLRKYLSSSGSDQQRRRTPSIEVLPATDGETAVKLYFLASPSDYEDDPLPGSITA